jgi:hypothetical protein
MFGNSEGLDSVKCARKYQSKLAVAPFTWCGSVAADHKLSLSATSNHW